MTRKKRRLTLLTLCLLGLGTATGLTLMAFEDNLLYFRSPTDLAEQPVTEDRRFRLGGLVAGGTIEQLDDGVSVRFVVTDTVYDVPVVYNGILPDLFREGQGVVAHGRLDDQGVFQADELLARHDESYMPPEVADALDRAGAGPLTAPHPVGNSPSAVY